MAGHRKYGRTFRRTGEKGLTCAEIERKIIGGAAIQTSFVSSKPVAQLDGCW